MWVESRFVYKCWSFFLLPWIKIYLVDPNFFENEHIYIDYSHNWNIILTIKDVDE
jgi:hypothetical protein